MSRVFTAPDGRLLHARRDDDVFLDWLAGNETREVPDFAGRSLEPLVADALGFDPAHEYPDWVESFAADMARSLQRRFT